MIARMTSLHSHELLSFSNESVKIQSISIPNFLLRTTTCMRTNTVSTDTELASSTLFEPAARFWSGLCWARSARMAGLYVTLLLRTRRWQASYYHWLIVISGLSHLSRLSSSKFRIVSHTSTWWNCCSLGSLATQASIYVNIPD